MKLYHGTSATSARSASTSGLHPRGDNVGNWEENPSRDDCVYLTSAYAPYFALCAAAYSNDLLGIVEVDTDLLLQDRLLPDEDFLEQATRKGANDDMQGRTAMFRDNLEYYQEHWENSVKHLGNCAYQDSIPLSAITRIAVIDASKCRMAAMIAADPMISLMNFQLCQIKYTSLTSWFMGDEVEPWKILSATGTKDVWEMIPEKQRLASERELVDQSMIEKVYGY